MYRVHYDQTVVFALDVKEARLTYRYIYMYVCTGTRGVYTYGSDIGAE